MGTVAEKLTYLNGTKSSLKTAINNLGGDITNETTFRQYATELNDIYDNLPKASDTGTNVSLSPTLKGRLGIVPKGNTLQDGEPTPDTPVAIQSATGTQKVVVSGKNLVNIEQLLTNLSTYTKNSDGSYTFTPKGGGATFDIDLPKEITYSYKITNGTGTNFGLRFVFEDGTVVDGVRSGSGTSESIISNQPNQTHGNIVGFKFNYSTNGTFTIKEFMVNKGTSVEEYQPYQEPQEVDIELSSRNKWDEEWEQGYYNANGNPVGNTENAIRSKNFIPVLPETNIYYYNGTNNGGRICFYDNNKNFISTITNSNAIRTIPANCYYIMFSTSTNYGSTYNNDICINISDEKNGTYTPYYNYSLNRIDDTYYDKIDGTPDNWVLYKNIGKVVLDGSESWSLASNGKYFVVTKADIRRSSTGSEIAKGYSDHYSPYNYNSIYNGTPDYGFGFGYNASTIAIRNKDITSKNDFTNWLSTHNTELLYVLAETQQTPITDTNLVSQLNELYYLQSYNDTTNIDVTGNLPMRITASAIKGA